MASEGAKLALIAHDDVAMRVLAAWACADIKLRLLLDENTIREISRLAKVYSTGEVADVLSRLKAVGCLRDGDVSDLADRLLQQRVLTSTGRKKK